MFTLAQGAKQQCHTLYMHCYEHLILLLQMSDHPMGPLSQDYSITRHTHAQMPCTEVWSLANAGVAISVNLSPAVVSYIVCSSS